MKGFPSPVEPGFREENVHPKSGIAAAERRDVSSARQPILDGAAQRSSQGGTGNPQGLCSPCTVNTKK